ncbi:MAG: hypothetical protein Q8Q25_01645 [bacterium]|nr:hypothetical protein [bacterium]
MNETKKYYSKSTITMSSIVLALVMLSIPLLYGAMHLNNLQVPKQTPKETWLTVFVHGIMSIKPHLSVNNFLHFMTDSVENTLYSQTVAYMREDDFFYQNQAMLGYGLIKIDPNNIAKGNTSSGVAYLYEKMHHHSGAPAANNLYYTFGWNGLLSPTARYLEGKKLFVALEKELKYLRQQNIEPKIRVIGYSHGANVALNLGAAHSRAFPSSSLHIDELILIGGPIQPDTDYLINDAIFKRVYNIYSLKDHVQTLDFFSFDRFFSNRCMKERKGFILPDKLVQVQLKVTRNTNRSHSNAKKLEKSKAQSIVTRNSSSLRDASPGHAELWFFGWTPAHYRQNYPLCPLPTVTITPFISHHLQDIKTNGQHIVFDVRPEYECIVMRRKNKKKADKVIAFIPRYEFEAIKNEALEFSPKSYTSEEYKQHIRNAIVKAKKNYQQQCEPIKPQNKNKRCKLRKQQSYYQVASTE